MKYFFDDKDYFTNKARRSHVDLEGIRLYVNMTEEDLEEARDGMIVEEERIVPPDKAAAWLHRNIPGDIHKEKLDYERFLEILSLDMMQNSSIIYHTDSVLECQLMCLIVTFLFSPKLWLNYDWVEEGGKPKQNKEMIINFQAIFFFLLAEHIFSYVCYHYRKWDIKHHGKADINGIFVAKTESLLKSVETFIDCMLFGYVLKHMFDIRENIHDLPEFTYWIMIDMIIMFCTLGYSYVTQKL